MGAHAAWYTQVPGVEDFLRWSGLAGAAWVRGSGWPSGCGSKSDKEPTNPKSKHKKAVAGSRAPNCVLWLYSMEIYGTQLRQPVC